MEFRKNTVKEEYDVIVSREEELKERVHNALLANDYEDLNELLETIELKHNIELKSAYEEGIKKGAYYQRVLDCKDNE